MATILNKYIWLTETIYRARKISFEEINARWKSNIDFSGGLELPPRTFHRWRNGVEEMFGLIIECDRSVGNLYYIANEREIQEGALKRWLFDTITVSNLLLENKQLKDRILLEYVPTNNNDLEAILYAMRNKRTLQITYQSYWKDNSNTFEIAPYCIKMFKQRWYMVGWSNIYQKAMIYALDRIIHLIPTEKQFIYPEDFCPEAFFEKSYGVMVVEDIPVEHIRIKITAGEAKYFRSLPLHSSQREIEYNEEYSIFEYCLSPTYDFKQELLAHLPDLVVLSPEWLRNEMREKVLEAARKYGKE